MSRSLNHSLVKFGEFLELGETSPARENVMRNLYIQRKTQRGEIIYAGDNYTSFLRKNCNTCNFIFANHLGSSLTSFQNIFILSVTFDSNEKIYVLKKLLFVCQNVLFFQYKMSKCKARSKITSVSYMNFQNGWATKVKVKSCKIVIISQNCKVYRLMLNYKGWINNYCHVEYIQSKIQR